MSAAHPTQTVLILGLGNDLLTDDAVGLQVAAAAGRELGTAAGFTVRWTTEMGLALLDEIAGCDALVLIDAVQTGTAAPGMVGEIGLDAVVGRHNAGPHFVGVGETLALGRALGLPMPRTGWIVTVEVAEPCALGTRLTPEVAAAVPVAAARAVARARELRESGGAGR